MADYAQDPDPLPSFWDRADGETVPIGDPTPAGAVVIDSSDGPDTDITIQEHPDSPTMERAEQCTITHKFDMSWAEAKNRIQYYGRGTPLVDTDGNNSIVLSAVIQHQKGEAATLEIVSVSTDFDPPPDKLEIVPVELGINILKYPRYFYAFNPTEDMDANYEENIVKNQEVIRALQNYFENTTPAYRESLIFQLYFSLGSPGIADGQVVHPGDAVNIDIDTNTVIPGTPTGNYQTITPIAGTDMAKRAAMEIIQKYWKNEETPYITAYQLTYTSFGYLPFMINPGGYVEDPIYGATPQLPDYLIDPNPFGDNDLPANIFDWMASINPQCFSSDGTFEGDVVFSCLRKADQQEYNLPLFKIDRTWLVSAIGTWDAQLYNQLDRPKVPDDYLNISPPNITKKTWTDSGISST